MIGDVIVISKADKKRAAKLVPAILKLKDRSIVAIQGGSGTRKTELMQCLQEELRKQRKKVLGISIDDYYKVHYKNRTRVRKRLGLSSIGLKELDWVFLKGILKEYKKEKSCLAVQYINKYTDSFFDVDVNDADKLNCVIVEGLYAGYLKKYKLVDLCIHLEGSPEQTLKFRKMRKKEPESSKFRQDIVRREYNIVSQLKKYADIIVEFGQ
jgi:uridine kinase